MNTEFAVIGKPIHRVDGRVKVTGEAKYTADLSLPGMLWGKVLRSPLAHARILNIDASRALRLPGVRAVVTGRDARGENFGFLPHTRDKKALETEKVRYVGDEIAAVAAIDKDIAEEALDLIQVDYEPLEAVFDPVEAMKDGAPAIHDHVKNNISAETHLNWGDLEQGFARSDLIREGKFTTQAVVHGFIEPHAALAYWESTGRAQIWASKQSPYIAYRHLARGLGIPLSKLRLVQPYVGGGFGGKHEPMGCDFAALLLSQKTGRPVKIVYSQEEVFLSGRRRHPFIFWVKVGMRKDGNIQAVSLKAIADGGAYTSVGPLSILLPGANLGVPLRIPAAKYDGFRIYTNKLLSGPLYGHCMPQTRYAVESVLDEMAEELGFDPVDLRLINSLEAGEKTADGKQITTWGFKETVQAVADSLDFKNKFGKGRKGRILHGVGIGSNPGFVSGRLGGHEGSAAMVKLFEDGGVTLIHGATDVGQGAETVLCQIVAESLGIDITEVNSSRVDTELTPMDPGTFGSRTTYTSGHAAIVATEDAKEQLAAAAAEKLECNPQDLQFKDHRIFVKGSPEKGISLLEAVRTCFYTKGAPVIGRGTAAPKSGKMDYSTGTGKQFPAFSSGSQGVEVEVDAETGEVRLTRMVISHDCGRALNPLALEGMQHGGAASAAGQVLLEEMSLDQGVPLATSFMDYALPTVMDAAPVMECFHVETEDPSGPFGAKDAGEGAQIAGLPAVAAALYDAIGVRFRDLPITREKVLAALSEKARQEEGRS
ncbi:MAG: molybdopterin-dependent oxidoreductase [Desulfobacterales bacterium]|nr:molybdopterin-dependent oxidoreductase [Desulfobacterales bacterium]